MRIIKAVVNGFFGRYSLEWDIKPNTNILSGINGSGKSTLLRAISTVLKGQYLPAPIDSRVGGLTLWFDDGSYIQTLIAKDIEIDKHQLDNFLAKLASNDNNIKSLMESPKLKTVSIKMLRSFRNGHEVEVDEFVKGIQSSFISTFDMAPAVPKDPGELMDQIVKSSRSELDRHLELVVDRFKSNQVELSNKMSQFINENDNRFEDIKKIFKSKILMQDILDRLLKESGKRVNRDKGDLEFIFKSDEKSHPYSDLSAGEKQLLLILLTVFLQENRESILIMDEPEISLHVDWQMQLLDIIYELNPNCQVIVSTHSPSMILNGWHSAVENISNLASGESV
ncbi:MAG: ATP-binding protein [Muribaculum sp.]|nr:ATP-binding protein [Muribaculum sp.]